MSATPLSRRHSLTLADVITDISAREDLPMRLRQDLASSVRFVCRQLSLPPEGVLADATELRRRLQTMSAATSGVTPARWRNVKSLFGKVLAITGAMSAVLPSNATALPAWQALLGRLSDRYERSKLSRLARYCTAFGIPPDQVSDNVVGEFGRMLLEGSLIERPKQVHRNACLAWNRSIDGVEGWPQHRLSVPDNRRVYALALDAFPESFQVDFQNYLNYLASGSLFGKKARQPASPITIRDRRIQLLEVASALVKSGRNIESICSLSDLVEPDAAEKILSFFHEHNGRRLTGQLHNFARALVGVAKWKDVPASQLEVLGTLRKQVDPGKGGMTERNKATLRPFNDPTNVELLVNLPDTIVNAIQRAKDHGYNDAILVQSALVIAFEFVAPLRAKNMAGLTIDRHIVRSRNGPGAIVRIVIPAGEVKNKAPLEFELPADVVNLLDFYISECRPKLLTEPSNFLFPARKGGSKDPGPLGTQIKGTIKKTIGLTINLHAFRHLCAFLFLKAHPGEYETVRLLLGHKSLATTLRFYCGMEESDAFRRLDALIDQYRHTKDARRAA